MIYFDYLEKRKMLTGLYCVESLGQLQKNLLYFAKKDRERENSSSNMITHRLTTPLSPCRIFLIRLRTAAPFTQISPTYVYEVGQSVFLSNKLDEIVSLFILLWKIHKSLLIYLNKTKLKTMIKSMSMPNFFPKTKNKI